MPIIDMPMGSVQGTQVVIERPGDGTENRGLPPIIRSSRERVLGVCQPVPNVKGMDIGHGHLLLPAAAALNYLFEFENGIKQHIPLTQETLSEFRALEVSAKITLLQSPKYGALNAPYGEFFYAPKPGYMGKDRVDFMVEMGEYKIKVIYDIHPVNGSGEGSETVARFCGKRGRLYKISAIESADMVAASAEAAKITG